MDTTYILGPDGELYHWGIKGMKWGQRRYQNKDGSLTPAGIKRYNREVQKLKDRENRIKAQEKAKKYQDKLDKKKSELDEREATLKGTTAKKPSVQQKTKTSNEPTVRKSVKDMSDEELAKVVRRLQLEQQYSSLNPQKISAGQKFAKKLGEKAFSIALDSGEKALRNAINKALEGDKKPVETAAEKARRLINEETIYRIEEERRRRAN